MVATCDFLFFTLYKYFVESKFFHVDRIQHELYTHIFYLFFHKLFEVFFKYESMRVPNPGVQDIFPHFKASRLIIRKDRKIL
jgi:hypothetical protein